MKSIEYVAPVQGAAEYRPGTDENGKHCVFMKCEDGFDSVIEFASSFESANAKAIKWQKKENKAVLKSQKAEEKKP